MYSFCFVERHKKSEDIKMKAVLARESKCQIDKQFLSGILNNFFFINLYFHSVAFDTSCNLIFQLSLNFVGRSLTRKLNNLINCKVF